MFSRWRYPYGRIAQNRPMAQNGNLGASFSVQFGEKTEIKIENNIFLNFRFRKNHELELLAGVDKPGLERTGSVKEGGLI